MFAASMVMLAFPLLAISPVRAAFSATFHVTSGPNPSVVGQQVGIMAVSSPVPWDGISQPILPTQIVTFHDGTNVIGQAGAFPIILDRSSYDVEAVFNYTFQTAGEHQIYATYPGDPNFSAFTTGIYTQNITTTASCPCTNWQTSTLPDLGALQAYVLNSNGAEVIPYGESDFVGGAEVATTQWNVGLNTVAQPTGVVSFAIDGQSVAQAQLTDFGAFPETSQTTGRTFLPVEPLGQHSFVANYLGDTTFSNWTYNSSSSQPFNFDVIAGQTRSTLNAASTNGQLSLQTSVYPQGKAFNGIVDYCSAFAPTGSVSFMNGSTVLATIPLSDATYNDNVRPNQCHYGQTADISIPVPPGAYNITAVYNGDSDFGSSTSPAQQVTVQGTPLSVTVPQNISINATGPNGAAVSYLVSTTGGAGVVSVNCDHPSGSTLPVGTTTVTCTASDTSNDVASGSFTVTVTGALGQTQNLLSTVTGSGPGQSLASKITTVEQDLQTSPPNTQDACGTLNAFINSVSAQSGKKLDTNTANEYISAAAQIAYVLGC